ncbi:hypothetical protein XENTR_v10005490 [Xenopus tropicalis]|nr:hypothetical protein XENTR_v10005490 [Xenopus tropicalis]KAE8623098.1 hypothetical protein XENTR_v10005490 [Xenopus tropicalis]
MGSGNSKEESTSSEVRTTAPTPTLNSLTTFTTSNTDSSSKIFNNCFFEILLAFFSGGLFTVFVVLIVLCVTKLKRKGNCVESKQSNEHIENLTPPDDHQPVSENENLTYAKIVFVNRESNVYDNS